MFFLIIWGCAGRSNKKVALSVLWENDRAVGLEIPRANFPDMPDDSVSQLLSIHLLQGEESAVFGDFSIHEDIIIYRPIVPFTRGFMYGLQEKGRLVSSIAIPLGSRVDAPTVNRVYPSQDTLPYNLLKFYIHFSKPMREGKSLHYVTLLKDGKDTVHSVFLDLQPELWNKDGSILTLWLDPGRIKRHLQPSQRLGEPLKKGHSYRLFVSSGWQDKSGNSLVRDFTKDFYVSVRDSLSPDPNGWIFNVPEAGTTQPLVISLNEPLDFILLKEAIRVADLNGNILSGMVELRNEESTYIFTPEVAWLKGIYELQIESRLEDLSGNNLNRPFDRDISTVKALTEKDVYVREFSTQ